MGGLSDFIFGSEGSYSRDPYGQLNPEQKTLLQALGPRLTALSTGGTPTYTGEFASPYTQIEKENLDRQARLGAMLDTWTSQFQPGQINPEVDANEWRKLNQNFYGTGEGEYPGIKALAEEQYAGPSGVGFWSTPRAQGVMNAYTTGVVNPYQNWRSEALQRSYQNALNYGTASASIGKSIEELAAVPRLIKQYNLDQVYSDWVRSQNLTKQYVDDALNFLNLSTVSETYTPGKAGIIGDLGAAAGGIIGNMISPGIGGVIGSQLGGSITGQFDRSGAGGSTLANAMSSFYTMQSLGDLLKGTKGANNALTAGERLAGFAPETAQQYRNMLSTGNYTLDDLTNLKDLLKASQGGQ